MRTQHYDTILIKGNVVVLFCSHLAEYATAKTLVEIPIKGARPHT